MWPDGTVPVRKRGRGVPGSLAEEVVSSEMVRLTLLAGASKLRGEPRPGPVILSDFPRRYEASIRSPFIVDPYQPRWMLRSRVTTL